MAVYHVYRPRLAKVGYGLVSVPVQMTHVCNQKTDDDHDYQGDYQGASLVPLENQNPVHEKIGGESIELQGVKMLLTPSGSEWVTYYEGLIYKVDNNRALSNDAVNYWSIYS